MGCMICHHEHSALETCAQCEFDAFVRNHFFTGKMMGAAEFAAETLYHSEKMRHHNARLHGSGAVCGLKVQQHPAPECRKRYVVVTPGSALDCCGREILVAQEEIVDVAKHPSLLEALARDAKAAVTRLHTLQLCVAYRECPTEDVPVLYDECGCDDTKCAPNRILESFRFDVLVDPPLPGADLVGRTPLGAFVATDQHDVKGFSRASAAGKVLAADPGDATRLFVIDARFRSMKTVALGAAARAAALSADGNFVFAVVGSQTRVFKVDDASEIVPADATKLQLPAAASGALYSAGGTGDNGFVVYSADSGKAYRWKADATQGLDDTNNAGEVALDAGLSGVTASADAAVLYGITSAGKVKQYVLAGGTKEFTTPTQPGALAAFALGTTPKPLLAVASKTDRKVYLIDVGAAPTALAATIDVDRQPLYVGATGTGDDVWLQVLEEESAHLYTQAVSLAPLVANPAGDALLAASRLAADGVRAIVLLFPDGQAGVIDPAALADSDCADHLWKQLQGCPACDLPDCVVLATIANYQADMPLTDAAIDNRLGRRIVASTATLQAWLQCLQLKGGIPGPKGDPGTPGANGTNGTDGQPGTNGTNGTDGKDGIGLYPDLPKILDIGWQLEYTFNLNQFVATYYALTVPLAALTVEQRVQQMVQAGKPPPLTVYFNKTMKGITRRTLGVTIEAPMIGKDAQGNVAPIGLYLPLLLKLYGSIIETPGPVPTPHTGEQAAYAVSFVLPASFFTTLNAQTNQPGPALPYLLLLFLTYACARANVDLPRVLVDLRGDFVYAPKQVGPNVDDYDEFAVLDGENIGGRVGFVSPPATRKPPILGGKNPSGNLTQGGLFESWFFLGTGDSHAASYDTLARAASAMTAAPFAGAFSPPAGLQLPATANFAPTDELAALPGVSRELAQRIVKAREAKPIQGLADLKKRAKLTDAEWAKLEDHLIVL